MEELLFETYEKVAYVIVRNKELNHKFDHEIESFIQPLKEKISAEVPDELRV